jgi:hypothetical protein
MTRAVLLALCGLVLWACGSDKRPREPAPIAPLASPAAVTAGTVAAPPPASAAPVAQAAEPEPTPKEIPLPEDFEAQAARQITADNFRTQLDAIEKEMKLQK